MKIVWRALVSPRQKIKMASAQMIVLVLLNKIVTRDLSVIESRQSVFNVNVSLKMTALMVKFVGKDNA